MITIAYLLIAILVLYAFLVLLSNWRYNSQVNRLFAFMDKSAPRVFIGQIMSKSVKCPASVLGYTYWLRS